MNRRSKRFTPTTRTRWLVGGILIGLTALLVGTLVFLFLSISGLVP